MRVGGGGGVLYSSTLLLPETLLDVDAKDVFRKGSMI